MDWDLEVKRLIIDVLDEGPSCLEGDTVYFLATSIVDNKLIISLSHIENNESKDFEVILKEINDNQQTPGPADSE